MTTEDYLKKLYLLYYKKRIPIFLIYLHRLSMELVMEVLRGEVMCIIGEFGQLEHYSNLIKQQLDHLIVSLEHKLFQFGKQLKISPNSLREATKAHNSALMNATIVDLTHIIVTFKLTVINQKILNIKLISVDWFKLLVLRLQ